MPEVGNLPLPRKLLERGITDMARVSDARMSGTALAQQDPQVVSSGGTQAGVKLAVGRPRRSAGQWCRPARRVALERLGEPPTGPVSVLLSHEDILSSEVSCLRGRSTPQP